MKNGGFKLRPAKVRNGPFVYTTFHVRGWLRGVYVRKQYKNRDEALGEKQRLEIQAANAENEIRPANTRLTPVQLGEAEAAFSRLGDRSLTEAVSFYLAEYRPPVTPLAIEAAVLDYQADRSPHWSHAYTRDTTRVLRGLVKAFPGQEVHTVSAVHLRAYLERLSLGHKGWNNVRGQLHAFFEFCRVEPRRWCEANPAATLPKFTVARGIPEILSAAQVTELMTYVEAYSGGPRQGLSAGCLVPYFALCTFAGIRPCLRTGEMRKLGDLTNLDRIIDLRNGVIRIGPDVAKTKDLRQITIQPNLRAWLTRYPLNQFPITLPNLAKMVADVRSKFKLSHDVLRHTFISMSVAKFKSLGGSALEAGNSERIIRRHYLNMVTVEEADVFWAIRPRNEST